MTRDALGSLYGRGHADATRTCENLVMPGKREQTVFTPASVLDVVRALFGRRISYDPCHGHPQRYVRLTAAGRKFKRTDRDEFDKFTDEARVSCGMAEWFEAASLVDAAVWTDKHGLTLPWPDFTFCNPPYATLGEWLAWSRQQTNFHVLLVPTRPHRKWWRDWARSIYPIDRIDLDPLRFHGHEQAFPAPLTLAALNAPASKRGKLNRFCRAAGLGSSIADSNNDTET